MIIMRQTKIVLPGISTVSGWLQFRQKNAKIFALS